MAEQPRKRFATIEAVIWEGRYPIPKQKPRMDRLRKLSLKRLFQKGVAELVDARASQTREQKLV